MLKPFIESIEAQGLRVRGIEVYQHGQMIAKHRWAPDYRYSLHSVSKSFTSCAIGMLVAEGKLSVDEHIIDIFPDLAPAEPLPFFDELTVEHLLTMNTGHLKDTVFSGEMGLDEEDGVRHFLNCPIDVKPGTHFLYNNGATYVLSAIVQRRSGETLPAYLKPRLFDPLGMDFIHWDTCPKNRALGYTGLYLNTHELAKMGLLYLNKGVWEGKQLVPAEWVARSGMALSDTTPHNDGPDGACGYGYQFWRCVPRAKAYRADGYLGQFIIVSDELDAVIAVSSWEERAKDILTTLWDTVTPILEEGK